MTIPRLAAHGAATVARGFVALAIIAAMLSASGCGASTKQHGNCRKAVDILSRWRKLASRLNVALLAGYVKAQFNAVVVAVWVRFDALK